MEGIITVRDSRANLDAMKSFRQVEAAKIVKSLSTEGVIDNAVDTVKSIVNVAGTVLTVVTKFFPGKIDDIAVAIAQPAVLNALDAGRNLLKGIFVNRDSQQIVASITDIAGNAKNITIKDTNLVETIKNKATSKFNNNFNQDNSVERITK